MWQTLILDKQKNSNIWVSEIIAHFFLEMNVNNFSIKHTSQYLCTIYDLHWDVITRVQ